MSPSFTVIQSPSQSYMTLYDPYPPRALEEHHLRSGAAQAKAMHPLQEEPHAGKINLA